MNELIQIENRDGTEVVNARDLWVGLESKQEFAAWVKSRLEGFEEGSDYVIDKVINNPLGGRPSIDYYLTIDTAKHVAMLERNDRGRDIRAYFIKVEQAWNTPELIFARALQAANAMLVKSQSKVAELTPKAESHDALMKSENTMSITLCAKHFGLHPKGTVFPYLREHGYLTTKDKPSQTALDADIMALVQNKDRFTGMIYPQAVVRTRQLEKWRTYIVPRIIAWDKEREEGQDE